MSNRVHEWEGDDTQPRGNLTWKSKVFMLPSRMSFNCARLKFSSEDRSEYWATVEAYEAAIIRNRTLISDLTLGGTLGEELVGEEIEVAGDLLEDVAALAAYTGDDELQLKIYMDGSLTETKEIYHEKPFRITGHRGRTLEAEIIGNVTVAEVIIATSVSELKGEQGE
jgi:hypothetical protein